MYEKVSTDLNFVKKTLESTGATRKYLRNQ